MIPAKQLMIGNWVYYQHENLRASVMISCIEEDDTNESLFPIPLTHDTFKQCGAKEVDGVLVLDAGLFKLALPLYGKNLAMKVETETVNIYHDMSHIKAVHHLQNLFSSLTGEELNFQP